MICDQCEREYHVGCLEKHNLGKLESLPEGDWFCDSACARIHAHFKTLVAASEMPADILLGGSKHQEENLILEKEYVNETTIEQTALGQVEDEVPVENDTPSSGNMRRSSRACVIAPKPAIKDTPYKLEIEDYSWQILNGNDGTEETSKAIQEATDLLEESFDPIVDLSTNTDLLPLMINAEQYSDWDYRGVHTIVLKYRSVPVVAAIVRVFGPQMAELPLIATLKSQRRRGHAKVLVDLFQHQLKECGVHKLVLPAAYETVNAWKNGFQVIDMPADQVRLAKHQLKVLVFPGTEMLWKAIDDTTPPAGHHILTPIISDQDAAELVQVVRSLVKQVEIECGQDTHHTVKITCKVHDAGKIQLSLEVINISS